jgi:putative tryptophan/tyrosine transport system permease protein
MISLTAFWGAIETGLLYGLVGLGVYLSFRVLQFPDLTVDGSFTLGGAIAASMIVQGSSPGVATLIALLAGGLAGFCTASLNVRFQILNLLASILVMIALYSINLRIMGRPNVPLLGQTSLFSPLESVLQKLPVGVGLPIVMGVIIITIKFLLDAFLASEVGLALRATGANPMMASAQGISTPWMVTLGLALSNALVALAGAMFAQVNGFADITMGVGTIVFGLAAVIMGETLLPTRSLGWATLGVIGGSVVYRIAVAIALNADALGLQAQDLNLVTAILVALALITLNRRKR